MSEHTVPPLRPVPDLSPAARGQASPLDRARAHAQQQHGVLSHQQARADGVPAALIRSLVRRGVWQRLYRGVYLLSAQRRQGVSPQARAMAVVLALGDRAAVVGPTAARLWDLPVPPEPEGTVHVATASGTPTARFGCGIVRHFWRLPEPEVTRLGGIRLSTPERTIRDTVLLTDRGGAIALVDAALHRRLVDRRALAEMRAANAGRPGARQCQDWWALADGRASSPAATALRLICADAGIPADTLAVPVQDRAGTVLGVADLGWRQAGLLAAVSDTPPAWLDRPPAPWRHALHFSAHALTRPTEVASRVARACGARGRPVLRIAA
ncbi:type IV toxin-antitoxin system AbiEi family antitoxin domain-containing protein [Allonocardiopsis opalescens]|uniref:Putative AbiEi antitoxin of type IV toxin-antitoxin system n=1 Tax=Allonocardiopsis opalescens TaxID=1144618 RepID=A0A2T0PXP1_9ACTN|nr:type IV toxin-antitoxin system AbiEi family antitoxin domain-containing protein [Allonocardiopsis opalescens]PRX96292.1 putative AbiEi antitoxin of type IV toxin-antitoxin system [Allonocardiopsis opalescens]